MPQDDLTLDHLRSKFTDFYSLRNTDTEKADAVLGELGASDEADRQIILELAAPKPLWLPDRFLEAHTLVVRSLEVLDRNATHRIKSPPLGPLGPVVRFFIELVTRFIVRNHLRTVTEELGHLYARREANCMPDDEARPPLRRARQDIAKIAPSFKKNPLGLPTFLLTGAVLSSLVSWLQSGFGLFSSSSTATVIATIAVFLVAASASWVIVRGAATAHRRIGLTVDGPLAAVYETIGRAGQPPQDAAGAFAIISIVLTLLALLIVPIGLALTILS
jgi:hypothetical protein